MSAALLAAATPANAVINGSSSSLGAVTVRLAGPFYCSGVAVARHLVITAAHCANRGMRILAHGGSAGIRSVSRSAVLDDGRRISVSGDAAILVLSSPLSGPFAPVGDGGGDSFTIAGYGTPDERHRLSFGTLREATLVAAPGRQLVDPNRSGGISASACFGDSGGPVMRGGMLVGIITRANYPNKRIACGFYTRWAPVMVSGQAQAIAAVDETPAVTPRSSTRQRHVRSKAGAEVASANLFGSWFTPPSEKRPASKRKRANVRVSLQEPAYPHSGFTE